MNLFSAEKVSFVLQKLEEKYPSPECELKFDSVYELLVAVILSAQCTDKRVNEVSKTLFKVANTPDSMAELPLDKLEELIYTCGFYRSKAKHIKETSEILLKEYKGQVPDSLDKLERLPGVGRKTASVVIGVGFGGQTMPVDTHVFRVSNRIGLANAKNVEKTEIQLKENIPQNLWTATHQRLVLFGRYHCTAARPKCAACEIKTKCDYFNSEARHV